MASDKVKFKHDDTKSEFTLEIEGMDSVAVAQYKEIKSGPNNEGDGASVIYDVIHTEVPECMRGRGIGAQLMRNLVVYARTNDIKLIPTCTYVAHYFTKNPSEKDVLLLASGGEK